jgi:hypothetical protein
MWKEHGLDPNWIESIPYYEYQMWIEKPGSSRRIRKERALQFFKIDLFLIYKEKIN